MHQTSASAPTRRRFLAGSLATAGTAALGIGLPGVAQARSSNTAGAYHETQRVDVHCHAIPPVYLSALHAAGITFIGGIPIPTWSPELAMQFMDQYGIAVQMLSISDPAVTFVAPANQPALARTVNEYLAGVVKTHPHRFGAFAVLPLSTVAAATAEATHALDTLQLDGIGLMSSYDGVYLGDPSLEPLLAELDKRRAWVFVHPHALANREMPDYTIPTFIAEYPFDTTRTILSLLFNNSLHRYPHIRWQFAHGGGTLPMLKLRIDVLAKFAKVDGSIVGLPAAAKAINTAITDRQLRSAHYDTALVAAEPSLAALAGLLSTEHILFGSDWPFAGLLYSSGASDPAPALSQTFTNRQRHQIDRTNARGQFPRLDFLTA